MSNPSFGTSLVRAMRLHCPRRGEGKLFENWFRMHANCPGCGLQYERAPGYFLGSAYINYGMTAWWITILYVTLHFGFQIENRWLIGPLLLFCVGFPLFFFRYARALWLAMDTFFDVTGSGEDSDRDDDLE